MKRLNSLTASISWNNIVKDTRAPENRLGFIQDIISETLMAYNYDPSKHEISSFVVMVGDIDSNENEQTVALSDGLLNSEHVIDYLKWLGLLQVVSQ